MGAPGRLDLGLRPARGPRGAPHPEGAARGLESFQQARDWLPPSRKLLQGQLVTTSSFGLPQTPTRTRGTAAAPLSPGPLQAPRLSGAPDQRSGDAPQGAAWEGCWVIRASPECTAGEWGHALFSGDRGLCGTRWGLVGQRQERVKGERRQGWGLCTGCGCGGYRVRGGHG